MPIFESLRSLLRPSASRPDGGKIRVVIELASFDKGGLEKVVLDSALAFDRLGSLDVTIVTMGPLGHLGRIAQDAGLKVVTLPSAGSRAHYRRFLKALRPDVAISHFSDIGYPVFASLGIPNLTFIHNVYAFFSEDQAKSFADNDHYVTRYISVSKNATRYAISRLHVSPDKITTIPNGLIISEHEARAQEASSLTRAQFGLGEADYVFANVASYNLHKGHYLMADAMQRILRQRNDIKILCVGNVVYPPHADELKVFLESSGLDKNIIMPGFFSEIQDVHRITDAFVLPSFIEGWSIAMNEAMFYEKPMILTDTGAASEVVDNGDIGILIPNEYGDTTELDAPLLDKLTYTPRSYKVSIPLADAMMSMADNRELWRQKAKLGRRKIYENFDFSNIIRQYISVISSITGRDAETQAVGVS